LALYGKRADQARALTGEAAVSIAAQARAAGKPVVLEKLAFQKKKEALEATGPRRARMISSFAYRLVGTSVKSACFRAGVETIEVNQVNPAYTSVIGAVNRSGREPGRGSKRRMQRMPGVAASLRRHRPCRPKGRYRAPPGLCRRKPGTRTAIHTVRMASWISTTCHIEVCLECLCF